MSLSETSLDGDLKFDLERLQSEPIWEGFLLKQGGARGGFRNWKKRWFRLDHENLCYFKMKPGGGADGKQTIDDSNSTPEPVLGILPIRNATLVDIQSTVDAVVKSIDTPPAWDVGATSCHDCKKDFSGTCRRRFCRACGLAHCQLCSPRFVILSKTGFADNIRVCNSCFNGITSAGGGFKAADQLKDTKDDGIITQTIEQKKAKGFEWGTKKHLFVLNSAELQMYFQADTRTVKLEVMTAIRSVVLYHRRELLKGPENDMKLSLSNAASPHGPHKLASSVSANQSQWNVDFKAIKILHEIGEGGSGMVYKGRLWGTDVAVKTIKNSAMAEDLQKEVAILSQLRHPNVVLYIGACLEPPNVAVVIEWCDRGSLFNLLYDDTPGSSNLDFQSIVTLAIGIGQGMNYLHSLNQKIIHRDLKSHNILVDSHFVPKVTDFGLSKVKAPSRLGERIDLQIATESLAIGHQKAMRAHTAARKKAAEEPKPKRAPLMPSGTAEWMAPEVMEGAPYNQSVDIYSYGIVLSELLSRHLPFRDRYNITGYADVVEAVLDDGAMPTIPDWCGIKMQKLVADCLNRNAEARPSFNEIILRLRSFYPLDTAEVFQKFDVPRIMSMLDSSDRTLQFRAVRELSDMAQDLTETCPVCGHTPSHYSNMGDAIIIKFVTRLNNSLLSPHADIVYHAMLAIMAMIDNAPVALRPLLFGIIRDSGGILRISVYLASSDASTAQAAGTLLSRTLAQPGAIESPFTLMGMSKASMAQLLNLAKQEVTALKKKIISSEASLARKTSLTAWLVSRLKQSEFAPMEPVITVTPIASTSMHVMPMSIVMPVAAVGSIIPAAGSIPNAPASIGASFEGKPLPVQLRAEMGRGAQCWGWLGLLDVNGEQWIDVYGVLRNATISLFDSEESRPENVRFIIRIRVGSVCAKFRSGRKRGRENCLQIALSQELLPVSVDGKGPHMRRVFINIGSQERFAFWVKHINEHLDIPVPLVFESSTESGI